MVSPPAKWSRACFRRASGTPRHSERCRHRCFRRVHIALQTSRSSFTRPTTPGQLLRRPRQPQGSLELHIRAEAAMDDGAHTPEPEDADVVAEVQPAGCPESGTCTRTQTNTLPSLTQGRSPVR